MPLKDGAGLNQAQSTFPSTPVLRKPSLKDPVQRRQAWSFGTTAQHEQLVSQGQNLQEQVPAGFQPGNRQVKRECQPTNHVAEDLWKHRRSPVFSAWMRFLPVTPAGNGLVLRWSGPGILQWAPTPLGPYTDLSGCLLSYTNADFAMPAKYFRVRR